MRPILRGVPTDTFLVGEAQTGHAQTGHAVRVPDTSGTFLGFPRLNCFSGAAVLLITVAPNAPSHC
jgi:hypothetical protein